jgi:hypothetical protein
MVYNDITKYSNLKKGKRMKVVKLIISLGVIAIFSGCALTPPPPPQPDQNAEMKPINPERITEQQLQTVRDEYRLIPVTNHLEEFEK